MLATATRPGHSASGRPERAWATSDSAGHRGSRDGHWLSEVPHLPVRCALAGPQARQDTQPLVPRPLGLLGPQRTAGGGCSGDPHGGTGGGPHRADPHWGEEGGQVPRGAGPRAGGGCWGCCLKPKRPALCLQGCGWLLSAGETRPQRPRGTPLQPGGGSGRWGQTPPLAGGPSFLTTPRNIPPPPQGGRRDAHWLPPRPVPSRTVTHTQPTLSQRVTYNSAHALARQRHAWDPRLPRSPGPSALGTSTQNCHRTFSGSTRRQHTHPCPAPSPVVLRRGCVRGCENIVAGKLQPPSGRTSATLPTDTEALVQHTRG